MNLFEILAALLGLTAVLGWLNHCFIRLPNTIRLPTSALILSLMLTALSEDNIFTQDLIRLLDDVHCEETLLHGS
ncbi:hypothetical protein [Caldichromatium japonicum]|uniref:hypothetical protein n=1 Tax=Caldichromatium japonicum TaxID=2699430 RepID=UPI001FE7B60D|nr:hypothetical protein [Caldichromatium japonicum]